jgi:hypothetical protein
MDCTELLMITAASPHYNSCDDTPALPKPIDKPHRSAGATQAALLRGEQRLLMGSHHDGDETKGPFIQVRASRII